jgi:hypothetical protein
MGMIDKLRTYIKPERKAFARLLMKHFRAANPGVTVHFDEEKFCISLRRADKPDAQYFLGTLFADYCRARPADRTRMIAALTATTMEAVPDSYATSWQEAKSHLLPRVRDRVTYALMRKRADQDKKVNFTDEPFTEHLALELVYDLPNSIGSVNHDQLSGWGVTRDEALAVARDNLWAISNRDFKSVAPGVHVSDWHDSYDASRLFLHDLIWQLPVRGDHVVMTPSRNDLFVTGSEDPDGLVAMATMAARCLADPRFITGAAVRLEKNKWRSFMPPEQSPAYELFRKVALIGFGRDYQQQCEVLSSALDEHDSETHIGRYLLFEAVESKAVSSKTLWIEGCTNILPIVDQIMFMARDKNDEFRSLGQCTWQAVQAAFGDMITPTDDYPPRFMATGFPTEQQIKAIAMPVQEKS